MKKALLSIIAICLLGTITTNAMRMTPEFANGDGGTIVNSGVGSEIVLTAIPNEAKGYEFLSWDDGNNSNPRTITDVTKSYNAIFVRTSFERGTLEYTPSGDFSSYSIHASTCGTFGGWSNGESSTTINYEESDETKCYVRPIFNGGVNHSEDNSAQGSVDVTKTGCTFNITAQPAAGYAFVKWQEDNSTVNPRSASSATALAAGHYTAIFGNAVAEVNTVGYTSMNDALNAISETGTVKLLATIDQDVAITAGKNITIDANGQTITGDLIVPVGAELNVSNTLVVGGNVYLAAQPGSVSEDINGTSSQVKNAANLSTDNLFVDITLENGQSTASDNKWYAISVPFEVDVNTGISRANVAGSCINKVDYIFWDYDGQKRADNQATGWSRMSSGSLMPGRFYMMGIEGDQNVWRFAKKASAATSGSTNVDLYRYQAVGRETDIQNRGWNAMGNSQLYYVNATVAGIDYAQIYDNRSESGKYDVVELASTSFVMATPFFIQTDGDGTLVLSDATHSTLYAPMRENATANRLKYEVVFGNNQQKDRLFITASDQASQDYQIGKDLIKMMGGNSDLYIYTQAYGQKLCAQDALLTNEGATYQIALSVPQMGEYTIGINRDRIVPNVDLLLTENGNVIWNLSESDYLLSLTKGTTNAYGLQIRGISQISTDLDKFQSEESKDRKYLFRNTLVIEHNGILYNAQGAIIQ
ncbi:MAG: hypothetical protein IJP52_01715 [Paludibacteraceae bacterium]|nr:hypothetical protein [Paludibacteraceae bacterium]